MNLDFIQIPVGVKAIQFAKDGSNWQEVVSMVALNGGLAEMRYLNGRGQPQPPGTITTVKGIVVKGPDSPPMICNQSEYILLNGREFYPVPEHIFNQYHLPMADVNKITNGQHTFVELYKKIGTYEPTLEEILVSDKWDLRDYALPVKEFVRAHATIHTDSALKKYYVLHGVVYTL